MMDTILFLIGTVVVLTGVLMFLLFGHLNLAGELKSYQAAHKRDLEILDQYSCEIRQLFTSGRIPTTGYRGASINILTLDKDFKRLLEHLKLEIKDEVSKRSVQKIKTTRG